MSGAEVWWVIFGGREDEEGGEGREGAMRVSVVSCGLCGVRESV